MNRYAWTNPSIIHIFIDSSNSFNCGSDWCVALYFTVNTLPYSTYYYPLLPLLILSLTPSINALPYPIYHYPPLTHLSLLSLTPSINALPYPIYHYPPLGRQVRPPIGFSGSFRTSASCDLTSGRTGGSPLFLGGSSSSSSGGQYEDPEGLHWELHIDLTTNAMYHFNTRTGEAKVYHPEVGGRPLEPQIEMTEGQGETSTTRRSASADHRTNHHHQATKSTARSSTPQSQTRVFEISSQLQLDQMKFKRRVYESKQREDDVRVEQQKYEDEINERYLRASLVSSKEGEFVGMKEREAAAEQRKAIRVSKIKENEEKKKREELEKERKNKEKHVALLAKIEAGEKLTWTEMEDRKKHEREARMVSRREELRAMSLGFEPAKGSDGRIRRRTTEKFYPHLYGDVQGQGQGSARSTGEDPFKVPSPPSFPSSLPLLPLDLALIPSLVLLIPSSPSLPSSLPISPSLTLPFALSISHPLPLTSLSPPPLSPSPHVCKLSFNNSHDLTSCRTIPLNSSSFCR